MVLEMEFLARLLIWLLQCRYNSSVRHDAVDINYFVRAVYFNPAKTGGAMVEADLYCLFGVVWATFITLGSMSMFWFLEVHPGFEWVGDLTVLVWIAFGMTAVAWTKVWMAKPSFNTACSMTSIILFIV